MIQLRKNIIKFRPRRTFGPTIIFFAGFGVFMVIGAVMLFYGIRGGIIMIAFSATFMLVLGIQVISPGSYYAIDSSGIYVRIMFRKRLFPFSEITGLEVISDYEAGNEMEKIEEEKINGMNNSSMKQAFEAQMKLGRFVQYSTAAIVFSEQSYGTEADISGFSARASGMFVKIDTDSGNSFLLSPSDVYRFESVYRDFSR